MKQQGIARRFLLTGAALRLPDAIIGGTPYPDALSGPHGPAPAYLELTRQNTTVPAQSLSS